METKTRFSKNGKIRNTVLAVVAENDPTRFRTRTVSPDKGYGRKSRPRNSNRLNRGED